MHFHKSYKFILLLLVVIAGRPVIAQQVRDINTIDALQNLGMKKKLFIQFDSESFHATDVVAVRLGRAQKKLEFSGCVLVNAFELSGIHHDHGLVMRNCAFDGAADFSYSTFADSLVLDRVTFAKNLKLTSCILPPSIHLKLVEFNGSDLVDFSSCQLPQGASKCILQLDSTSVYELVIPYNLFEFNVPIQKQYGSAATSVYESLIRNCKEAHLLESAEMWDIEYLKYQNNIKFGFLGPAINYLQEEWWNFGYNREWVFWKWLPIWFLVFLVINSIFLNRLLEIYNDEEIGRSFGGGKKIIHGHRFTYALIYTAAIYFHFGLSVSAMNFRKLGIFYIFLVYIVGTLHVIIGITGSIISHY
jgi:hypothetical protein